MAHMTYKDLVWVVDDYDGECIASVRFPNSWEVEVFENANEPTRVMLNGIHPEGGVCSQDMIYEGNTDKDADVLAVNLILRIVPCLPPCVPRTSFPEFDEPLEDL